MGLDMYAIATSNRPAQAVDFVAQSKSKELHYWRKHPNLHGWMEKLYQAKGGKNPDFNWSAMILEAADLDQLEAAIVKDNLPVTSGFFFGKSDGSRREDDLLFVRKARAAIKNGKTVYYLASF